jgi:OPA family glycerol-3-phosphate transporter-like MFS transporter
MAALNVVPHPPGFRARRGLNWTFIGLLYTSFYMCRYNLPLASGAIGAEFGFNKADIGAVITIALLAYACGQIINGLLADRFGGKKAMLIGAAGTIIFNLLFGAASMYGHFSPASVAGLPGSFHSGHPNELQAEEIVAKSLVEKLRQKKDAFSADLAGRLSEPTRQLLSSGEASSSPVWSALLTQDLNALIKGPSLYDPAQFATYDPLNKPKEKNDTRPSLSRGTTELLLSRPSGDELVRLNRLLLDEAYSQEIRRSSQWLLKIPLFPAGLFLSLLSLFVLIRGIDGYMQAFGAPGMVKINAAWFRHTERGGFAGIFGFMINLGRFGIFKLGPALLAGFTFLGLLRIPPLHWRWLFWIPAGITLLVAICMAILVKDTPERAGFPPVNPEEENAGQVKVKVFDVFRIIVSNPVIWIVASAYACTGAVRQGIDQWFPRFMQEVHHVDYQSAQFQLVAFSIPFVASAGSLISGFVSDKVFKGRRAPVAAFLYFFETVIILAAAQFHSVNAAIFFLVLISLTANSTHSILGTAAAMDIGGAKMAGFASGVIDSFQYFGGSLAGYFLGALLDRSWGNYFYFMAPFGVVGGVLMLTILGRVNLAKQPRAVA